MTRQLKQDLFGCVLLQDDPVHGRVVVRELTESRWWLGWLARHLARREVAALRRLAALPRVPRVLAADRHRTLRSWIDGEPMQVARPTEPRYFREALRLLRQLHAQGVVHNDLAKEPNWLVTPNGEPALVDFQLALCRNRSTRLFRILAHDDLRHLLKHKRTYIPARLTARQKRVLATPSIVTRIWMATGKRLYRFITRRLLRWSDREGAGDRQL